MTSFLLLLAVLFSPSTPVPTGGLSGRVTLVKNGATQTDASSAVVWIEGVHRAGGLGHVVMKSEKKKFAPRVLVVSREGAVDFPNIDPIYHNVFSVSGANRFDLGLYRAGASKEKKFEEPGLVRIYCNIHPQMVGFIMVVDSDFAAVTSADGSFRFDGVPTGSHRLRVWHEERGDPTEFPVVVRPRVDSPVSVPLDISGFRVLPHKNKYGKDYPPQSASDDDRY